MIEVEEPDGELTVFANSGLLGLKGLWASEWICWFRLHILCLLGCCWLARKDSNCLLSVITVYCQTVTVYCRTVTVYCLRITVYCQTVTVYCQTVTVYCQTVTVNCLILNSNCLLADSNCLLSPCQLLTGQPGARASGQGLIHQGKVPQTESMEVWPRIAASGQRQGGTKCCLLPSNDIYLPSPASGDGRRTSRREP